ncbi:Zn-dependent protease with chaperone function-like protein [Anabaenopsis circularis NIES-21]|uniref:Zn-dependent protease with chaperone function-like protein n=2 Tax=Nostocales TaxID=1161 RepID=A0A1Z4GGC8_9CYAN|nr:M48 family metallopeptidase [Nostoc cycadae]BAY16552.1 Zn-dependent protease with chaperone function-like protein [Anabaenopsis circularis NIES-21]GBE94277.1 peptidase M48 Ste24p [Nostoc cycadae WK-1]
MAFDQQRFDKLIQRLEIFASQQPPIYRLQVAFLAVLGYAYIFLILAVTVGLLVGIIWLMLTTKSSFGTSALKAVIVLVAIAIILVRSLWVSFPPPTGLALRRKDVPSLFCLVDDISSKLKAPRFHHILLTTDFNASVVQRPRLGLFGWYQNYLIVGLPLMLALPPEQFRAVLAHEMGHISGNHSRFAAWIYRQRLTWYRIEEGLGKGGNESSWFIFKQFLQWYIPFFYAYSFVLARLNEYEADKCAVEIAGIEHSAKTLMNVEVKARFLENYFWSDIYQQVQTDIEPPKTSYTAMQTALAQGVPLKEASIYLTQALAKKTNNADTHPCLTDRLKALGCIPSIQEELAVSAPVRLSAAHEFLGTSLEKFRADFSQTWYEKVATPWRQKYAEVQQSLALLEKLNAKAERQQLSLGEATTRALLTFELDGEEAVIPLLREVINLDHNHASANYLLGQILLKQEDASGIEHIERAIAQDIDIGIDGYQIIFSFLKKQRQDDRAELYQERAEKHYDLILRGQKERSSLQTNDEFKAHDISEAEINKLRQQLSRYPHITTAYLTQKVVQYFPEKPLYILAVMRSFSFWENNHDADNAQLVDALLKEVELPGGVFCFILNSNLNFEKKFKQIPDATIYQQKIKK